MADFPPLLSHMRTASWSICSESPQLNFLPNQTACNAALHFTGAATEWAAFDRWFHRFLHQPSTPSLHGSLCLQLHLTPDYCMLYNLINFSKGWGLHLKGTPPIDLCHSANQISFHWLVYGEENCIQILILHFTVAKHEDNNNAWCMQEDKPSKTTSTTMILLLSYSILRTFQSYAISHLYHLFYIKCCTH